MSQAEVVRAEALARAGDLHAAEALLAPLVRVGKGGDAAAYLYSSVLILQRRHAEAEPLLLALAKQAPDNLDVVNSLGVIALEEHQDWKQAEQLFRKVVDRQPRNLLALGNLGNAYFKQSRLEEAERTYRQVLAVDGNNVNALNNLGALAKRRADFTAALDWYRRAYAVAPQDPSVLRNLLITEFYSVGDDEASLKLIREILALPAPGVALLAVYPLAKLYCMWEVEERIREPVIQMALQGQADQLGMEMILLNAMANPELPASLLFEMHKVLGRQFRQQLQHAPFTRWQEPGAKLRIGYISGDFRAHSVHKFLKELVGRYDRSRFEVYCYSTVNPAAWDPVTEEYRRAVDCFVDASDMAVPELAARIHADGINLLVSLTGYTGGARMGVTCYRPAPVQISYLGYPYTTGLEEMDFMVSDLFLDTPTNGALFTERALVLPRVFVSHEYVDYPGKSAAGPQARNGYVTFGSLNNPYKLNRQTVATWAAVLARVPGSRLVLNNPKLKTPENRENILAEFARHGISAERIDYVWERHPDGNHLAWYNDIDLSLDTFPLTGGTTTVDSVLMGVPVVTLVGEVYYQRLSYSILSGCGLDVSDLVAASRDEYVEKAVALASDPARLTALRRRLLEEVPRSPLCDAAGFARAMEAAYVTAWEMKRRGAPAWATLEPFIAALEGAVAVVGATEAFRAEVVAAGGARVAFAATEASASAEIVLRFEGGCAPGSNAWRYVPALDSLVPVAAGEEGAGAFVCLSGEAVKRLRAEGRLLEGKPSGEIPLDADPARWVAWLSSDDAPFGKGLVEAWAQTFRNHPEWELFSAALNCFAAGSGAEVPEVRLGNLERSNEILLLLAQEAPTAPRLLVLLRVSMALGLWGQAAIVAAWLDEWFASQPYVPDEPVVPFPGLEAPLAPALLGQALAASVRAARTALDRLGTGVEPHVESRG